MVNPQNEKLLIIGAGQYGLLAREIARDFLVNSSACESPRDWFKPDCCVEPLAVVQTDNTLEMLLW